MDHRGTKLVKFALLLGLIGSISVAATEKLQLQEVAWLEAAGRFEALSSEPVMRIAITDIRQENVQKIMIGQALFHTPTLLGGQAAKAGISCASCHTNGRDNPYFQFPGVSGAPGTADVTHSFFSSYRGDGAFNPVAIPDLTKPGKISRSPKSKELEKFVRGLIVEEFNGEEPSIPALAALGAYIRSLAPSPPESAHLSIETHFDRTEEAFESGRTALWGGDRRLASLLFAGARHQTGLIHQRFQGKSLSRERQVLEALGQGLGTVQRAIDGNGEVLPQMLQKWSDDFSRARDTLEQTSDQSLYNPDNLKTYLEKIE